jgi:hypothetical protein
MNNERFYRYQYLTGQISLADYKELVALEKSMRSINQDLKAIGFDYAGEVRKLMTKFRTGDHVQLKDSPYHGTVEESWGYVRFRTPGGIHISVGDTSLLTLMVDPKPGDIYEDKNGNEWVILKQRGWSHHPEDMICARLISYTEVPGYQHSTLALTKPENITKWSDEYGPKLVRRA